MNKCQITGRPHGVYRKLKISELRKTAGLQEKYQAIKSSCERKI